MTPAEHKTEAESLLTLTTDATRVGPSDADFDVIAAHAVLSQAAGTGTHYTDAEAALDQAEAAKNRPGSPVGYMNAARAALVHAHLADR